MTPRQKGDLGTAKQPRRIVRRAIRTPETTFESIAAVDTVEHASTDSKPSSGGRGLVLKIPRRLESPNVFQGRHWRTKHRISQQWEQSIWIQAAMERGRPETILELAEGAERRKMRVVVERHVPSKRNFIRDDDNLRFAVKPLMDALKRQGYIYDDSRKWLEHPTPTQHVSQDGKDWTVVSIEPVASSEPR